MIFLDILLMLKRVKECGRADYYFVTIRYKSNIKKLMAKVSIEAQLSVPHSDKEKKREKMRQI